jgi:membrane-associated phospholipid phosphatase
MIPTVTTWVRVLNLWILKKGTIHVGVFPSAHVSSAFAGAWGMFFVLPRRTIAWVLLLYALSVSLSTIYGRYHYTADVLAGIGISVVAGAICWWGLSGGAQPTR